MIMEQWQWDLLRQGAAAHQTNGQAAGRRQGLRSPGAAVYHTNVQAADRRKGSRSQGAAAHLTKGQAVAGDCSSALEAL